MIRITYLLGCGHPVVGRWAQHKGERALLHAEVAPLEQPCEYVPRPRETASTLVRWENRKIQLTALCWPAQIHISQQNSRAGKLHFVVSEMVW